MGSRTWGVAEDGPREGFVSNRVGAEVKENDGRIGDTGSFRVEDGLGEENRVPRVPKRSALRNPRHADAVPESIFEEKASDWTQRGIPNLRRTSAKSQLLVHLQF